MLGDSDYKAIRRGMLGDFVLTVREEFHCSFVAYFISIPSFLVNASTSDRNLEVRGSNFFVF